jgi:hypothetical protein
MSYPRSKSRDCERCYGNGCGDCGMTGHGVLDQDERDDYDEAMERRAEERRDDDMMEAGR